MKDNIYKSVLLYCIIMYVLLYCIMMLALPPLTPENKKKHLIQRLTTEDKIKFIEFIMKETIRVLRPLFLSVISYIKDIKILFFEKVSVVESYLYPLTLAEFIMTIISFNILIGFFIDPTSPIYLYK